jgi:ABC-2 type transport system ATP-binding protein
MPDPMPAIEVSELAKRHGLPESGLLAVDGISFQVHSGEVFGYLGPNGAGKTTTVCLLAGLSEPTAGQARVLGLDRSTDLPQIKKWQCCAWWAVKRSRGSRDQRPSRWLSLAFDRAHAGGSPKSLAPGSGSWVSARWLTRGS